MAELDVPDLLPHERQALGRLLRDAGLPGSVRGWRVEGRSPPGLKPEFFRFETRDVTPPWDAGRNAVPSLDAALAAVRGANALGFLPCFPNLPCWWQKHCCQTTTSYVHPRIEFRVFPERIGVLNVHVSSLKDGDHHHFLPEFTKPEEAFAAFQSGFQRVATGTTAGASIRFEREGVWAVFQALLKTILDLIPVPGPWHRPWVLKCKVKVAVKAAYWFFGKQYTRSREFNIDAALPVDTYSWHWT